MKAAENESHRRQKFSCKIFHFQFLYEKIEVEYVTKTKKKQKIAPINALLRIKERDTQQNNQNQPQKSNVTIATIEKKTITIDRARNKV